MNVRMRSEPKGFVILLLSLCYRYLELILCLWLNASMLLKYFNKETGRAKVFHSNNNWLGIILLYFSDINILRDYQACSSDQLVPLQLPLPTEIYLPMLRQQAQTGFSHGKCLRHLSYLTSVYVRWAEEVPVYETASKKRLQRCMWFVATEVAAWNSRKKPCSVCSCFQHVWLYSWRNLNYDVVRASSDSKLLLISNLLFCPKMAL